MKDCIVNNNSVVEVKNIKPGGLFITTGMCDGKEFWITRYTKDSITTYNALHIRLHVFGDIKEFYNWAEAIKCPVRYYTNMNIYLKEYHKLLAKEIKGWT